MDNSSRDWSTTSASQPRDWSDTGVPRSRVSGSFLEALSATETKLKIQARQKIYYDRPDIWAWEVLGFWAWSKQRAIGQSVVDNSYTAVKSCHGAGKSAWAAVLVCWYVSTRLAAGEKVFVITTAPSYSQVHLVLWEEIRNFHAKGHLPGYITGGDEWKLDTPGRSAVELAKGRKPSDTDENSFQGKHADNFLIVLDEANGIPETIFTSTMVMLTGDMARQKMLIIGNPDDPNSFFGAQDSADKKRALNGEQQFWNWIQIKAWDTPNFSGELVHTYVNKVVLSHEWVRRAEQLWGRDDPRWISKVEAEFPEQSDYALFSRALIDQATEQTVDPGWEHATSRIMSADIARFGQDRTVIALNIEGDITILDSWAKKDTLESANRIHMLALEHHVTQVRVDEGNMGAGVVDFLKAHHGWDYAVIPMNGANSSPDIMRWRNARDYWYDNLREQMYMNKVRIPNDTRLHTELAAIRYDFVKGALKVEEKSEIKKRLKGASPDFADAVVYVAAELGDLIDPTKPRAPRPGEQQAIDFALQMELRNMVRNNGYSVSPL